MKLRLQKKIKMRKKRPESESILGRPNVLGDAKRVNFWLDAGTKQDAEMLCEEWNKSSGSSLSVSEIARTGFSLALKKFKAQL